MANFNQRRGNMSNSKNSKALTPAVFIVLASVVTLCLHAGPAWSKDYDFSFTPLDITALKVDPGDMVDFYVDFKNEGDQDDSYMFYCGAIDAEYPWMALGCFEDVCWGSETYNPVDFASGETDHMHAQVITPSDPTGTIDAFLKATSQTTGISKTVYFTVSTEESPAIRVMIYANQDQYKVGDDLVVNLRIVNLGLRQTADTYVALLTDTLAYFFQKTGILSTDVAPYTAFEVYPSEHVSDEVIISVPLTIPLGLDYLILASVIADGGTTVLLSEISHTVITFE